MASHFRGGPCDGKRAPSPLYGTVWCGGVPYFLSEDLDYYAASAIPTTTPVPGETNVYHAWGKLMRTIGVLVPKEIHKSASARARFKRIVRLAGARYRGR